MGHLNAAKTLKKDSKGAAEKAKGNKSASGKGRDVDPVSKPVTKKARLIGLLGTKAGVTIAEISEELGWQQHTTRAALTGLRKAGFDVYTSKPSGGGAGRYRITGTGRAPKTVFVAQITKPAMPTKKTAVKK